MKLTISFLSVIVMLFSCKEEKSAAIQSKGASSEQEVNKPVGALAEKLYVNYVASPMNQDQKDENAIIEYAVDKGLDVQRTNSGLYYYIEKEGVGPNLIMGQPCKAHYNGAFLDGKIFDSSHNRGEPIIFSVGQMNAGWNEALQLMNTGTKAKLLLPSRLAYGEKGFPGYVPPNTPLYFDLELLPLNEK